MELKKGTFFFSLMTALRCPKPPSQLVVEMRMLAKLLIIGTEPTHPLQA